MSREYWLSRWAENRIGFHKPEVNPLLKRFLPLIASPPGRVLVPLCGKTEDLIWLAAAGYDVTGVELSEIAARTFVSEHKLMVAEGEEPPFKVLRSGRIEFLAGSFFDFTPETRGRFDVIYDRAALIALPADLRPAYARKIQSLIAPNGHVLLITLEYNPQQMDGPPFNVPESEVRTLFPGYTIDKMDEQDNLEEEPHFKARGLAWMKEVVYHVRKI